jgi:hypothetical protein
MGLITALQEPVTVRLIPPDSDVTGLGDLLLRSLGLTGVLMLIAIAAGAVFAGILYYVRSRSN